MRTASGWFGIFVRISVHGMTGSVNPPQRIKKALKWPPQVVALLLIAWGCTKDATPAPQPTLIGVWHAISVSMTSCDNSLENFAARPCAPVCATMTFGSSTLNVHTNFDQDGSYVVKNDSIIFTLAYTYEIHKFHFKLTETDLTLSELMTDGTPSCVVNSNYKKYQP